MTSQFRHFIAPGAYIQGPGVLDAAAEQFETLNGHTAYILGGHTALSETEDRLTSELREAGIDVGAVDRGVGQCTLDTIDDHADRARDCGADIVVGVGGGVALDVATAVAEKLPVEFVSVPTIASTDAPCSTVAVVYDDHGRFQDVILRERNPELVLVDTRLIARAPVRFLRHGMGDAFATRFEAEAVAKSQGITKAGGQSSYAALTIANEAYDRLKEYGTEALAAADRDAVTPAFERIVETNILLSGLGFESGGTAGAHGFQIGFTNAGFHEPHGVLVGFGTIAELVLQGRDPSVLDEVLSVYCDLGLDVTLDDLGVDDATVDEVGRIACDYGIKEEPFSVTPEMAADAVRTADELIRDRRS